MPVLQSIAGTSARGYGLGTAAGETNSFYSLASYTVPAGGTSLVTFSGISQDFTHLQIRGYGIWAGTVGAGRFLYNNNTSSVYSYTGLNTDGTTPSSSVNNSQAFGTWNGNAGTVAVTAWVMDINEYTSTTKNKLAVCVTGWSPNYVEMNTSVWANQAAINRIDFYGSNSTFAEGSTISIYGIKE